MKHQCKTCPAIFTRIDNLARHMKGCHGGLSPARVEVENRWCPVGEGGGGGGYTGIYPGGGGGGGGGGGRSAGGGVG